MYRLVPALKAAFAALGGAFLFSPAGRIDRYIKRQSVEDRLYQNFARVGARMEAAMARVKDEQRKQAS